MMQDNSQESLSAVLKPAGAPNRFRPQPALLVSTLALLVAAGFGFYQFRTVQALQKELQRSQSVSSEARQRTQEMQQAALEQQKALEARFALLEAHQAETQGQQQALGAMYEALTRSDAARTLSEIEQILTFTSQQLQLTGNTPAALSTLADVDYKLARLNRPELISLRQAIAKDTDTLKALPAYDVFAISLKLDQIAGMISKVPMSIDSYREPPKPAPKVEGDTLARLAAEVWHELKQLIQIRRMDRPDALLLSPEQAFFVRENLKLRLMNARNALLLRDQATYLADLKTVQSQLRQHFDPRSPETVTTQNLIAQLIDQPMVLKLPDLAGSLGAVRNARNVVERAKP